MVGGRTRDRPGAISPAGVSFRDGRLVEGDMRPLVLLPVLAALLMLLPAGAASGATISPPGNSGITQYTEVVPTAGGGKPSRNSRSGKVSPLSKRQRLALGRAGADGRQLASVVAGTSPDGQRARRLPVVQVKPTASKDKHKSVLATALADSGGGTGDGGLGIPLLAPMLGAALLVGVFALGRRRGLAGRGEGADGPADGEPEA